MTFSAIKLPPAIKQLVLSTKVQFWEKAIPIIRCTYEVRFSLWNRKKDNPKANAIFNGKNIFNVTFSATQKKTFQNLNRTYKRNHSYLKPLVDDYLPTMNNRQRPTWKIRLERHIRKVGISQHQLIYVSTLVIVIKPRHHPTELEVLVSGRQVWLCPYPPHLFDVHRYDRRWQL